MKIKDEQKPTLQGINKKNPILFSDCIHRTCIKCNIQANHICSTNCPCFSCKHFECTSNTARFHTYQDNEAYLYDNYKINKED